MAQSVLLFKDGDSDLPLSDVFCQPPKEVEQGYVVAVHKTEYEAGFEIHYLCKKNFLLDGPQKVTCLPNGSWSQPPPFCRGEEPSPWTILYAMMWWSHDILFFLFPVPCTRPFRLHDTCVLAARCLIPAERSRVVIAGVKRWPFDVTDAMVPHGENVTFYCKHPHKQCGFGGTQTCFDGKLQPPACYLGK